MAYIKRLGIITTICGILPACMGSKLHTALIPPVTRENIPHFFPQTVADIITKKEATLAHCQKEIAHIVALSLEEQSFDAILGALDRVWATLSHTMQVLRITLMLHPDEALRNAAQTAVIELAQANIDLTEQNVPLYKKIALHAQTRAPQEDLAPEDTLFLKDVLEQFQRNGLTLAEQERLHVLHVQKELVALATEFQKNIDEDNRTIEVDPQELSDVDRDFVASLKKTAHGLCILGIDKPTYFKIMDECSNVEIRKKMYEAYVQRAYPKNISVLRNLIAKRHQLAQLVGYPDFAHLDVDEEMAKNPETVQKFLEDLYQKVHIKAAQEYTMLSQDLPPSVQLDAHGQIQPYDKAYLMHWYKKKHYNIDRQKVAEYFPMEQTIEGLFAIYQKFFDITFIKHPTENLWHETLHLVEVQQHNICLGYILLDLFPRDNKFNHACQITIVPTTKDHNDQRVPGLMAVVANFPPATATKPSLLTDRDVITFFHEFGHALHALFGATKLASQSGTQVKTDFVEMPSQMLEEWLHDTDILRMISHHYQTGKPLPEDILRTLHAIKNLYVGLDIERQMVFALFSLACYGSDPEKDLLALYQDLHTQYRPHEAVGSDSSFIAQFGHLTGYGSKYYSYLWSQIFALDLFETIKKEGLLNPVAGTRYVDCILSKGGSKQPQEMLREFLGRDPNQDAFIASMGL